MIYVSDTHETELGGERMTNTVLLQQKIEESGLGPVTLAAAWGVSLPTYYKLKSGESEFTASIIVAATRTLKLTRDERDAIFLS
jgi:hypothetical protein